MYRIGYGTDVHALVAGRKLIIGGIQVPFEKGLAGHSDADVLVHAICDALLGAMSLGDIGKWFPDTDNKYKNIDSCILLVEVVKECHKRQFKIQNIDVTILARAPKFRPYIAAMTAKLCTILLIELDQLNIKATTTEGLGFIGQGQGIEVRAVCLLAL